MAELKIKTEFLPTRCEICHQADKFDPYLEICLRCTNFSNNEQTLKTTQVFVSKRPRIFIAVCLSILGSLIGTIVGFFVGIVVNANEWTIENKTVVTHWLCMFIGQIGLPFILLKVNLQFIKKLFLWSIVGSLSSIFSILTYNIIMILFLERTLDIYLAEPIRFNGHIVFALILGVNLGMPLGFFTEWCFSKLRNRREFFIPNA